MTWRDDGFFSSRGDGPISAAEQARKDVEGWLAHTTDDTGKPKYVADSHHSDLDRDDLDALITLLTPVYERAQVSDERAQACGEAVYDAFRERAERAEAERDEWKADRERYLASAKTSQELAGVIDRRCKDAEADVARLREALQHYAKANSEWGERAREALAATERKGEQCGQSDTSGLTGFRCGESVGHSGPHAPRPSKEPKT